MNMSIIRKMMGLLVLVILVLTVSGVSAAEEHHAGASLVSVGGSGVTGKVNIEQLPHGGTNIHVVAKGLIPGVEYLSLYYENHTCALEPYDEDDVIGTYTANAAGVGVTQGKLEDDLDEINSISVRRVSDFALLACADVHPEP
jgi:hypothetical protein